MELKTSAIDDMATSKITNIIVDVAHGGTGASTAVDARTNLGIEKKSNSYDEWTAITDWAGQISNDGKTVGFTIHTKGQYLNNISNIAVNKCEVVMRGIKGYIGNFSSYTEFVGKNGYSVTATKNGMNCARILITATTAFTNMTNNTPVTVSGKVKLTYT